ncbi:hypothetical protein BKA80DRAFT_52133 [Phyllosticta citrichinensis]
MLLERTHVVNGRSHHLSIIPCMHERSFHSRECRAIEVTTRPSYHTHTRMLLPRTHMLGNRNHNFSTLLRAHECSLYAHTLNSRSHDLYILPCARTGPSTAHACPSTIQSAAERTCIAQHPQTPTRHCGKKNQTWTTRLSRKTSGMDTLVAFCGWQRRLCVCFYSVFFLVSAAVDGEVVMMHSVGVW